MRIVRFVDSAGRVHWGSQASAGAAEARRIDGDIFGQFRVTEQVVPIAKLLAPVQPPAIMCIGLNYRAHANETGAKLPVHPVLFMKNPAAVQNPGDPIELPTHLASHSVDYECELAVIIGKSCKNATPETALDYVLGYTAGNDVSARDWQKEFGGSQWCRGKTFDTFCPLGPAIITTDEIPDPNRLALSTTVNGQRRQSSNTADMIFSVRQLIAFLSGSTTLLPGTVIMTGTPDGVGMGRKPPVYLKGGDQVMVSVEKIGELSNPVRSEG
jgi:2-keto-4-pentenoate hydratase/2-oxohepta-3-ene-1,7-dioic acid hydratase in catechol pathway